jgi:hypothetical protein
VVKFFCNESNILVLVFCVLFVVSFNFDFFYLCVYSAVFCKGYHVFLLLNNGCSSSMVLFVLTTV